MGSRRRSTFPLVPRYRVSGQLFGGRPSLRRGHGTDVAGSRPYVPGDPISTIDWRASARLSTARNRDEFLVRERYADEAPRVVLVRDRRASMSLYGPPFPWLSKPDAVHEAIRSIAASADAANSPVAYLEHVDGQRAYWLPPSGTRVLDVVERRLVETRSGDAPTDAVLRALEFLWRVRSDLGSGAFVFVISDFLGAPVPASTWLTAAARRWEIVPVVVQDPVWEQSFPLLPQVTLPLSDPDTGAVFEVRLTRKEMRERRAANEERLAALLRSFASLGLTPVLLDTADPGEIDRRFIDWAAERVALRVRR